jgi:hypothetical protein
MPAFRSSGRSKNGAGGWLELADGELLAQCEVDTYRASGPGGQKRNKTSSAVRLRHCPTGLIVIAEESRSQHENRARALLRLREAIALGRRNTIDPAGPPPACVAEALARNAGLRVSRRNPDYFKVVQYVLDVLAAKGGSVADTAAIVGVSTAQLVRFLRCDVKLWAEVNRMRAESGQRPLT